MINEDKATRYHRRRRHAEWMAGAAAFAVLTLLVLSGAARWLADAVERWALAGLGPTMAFTAESLAFAAILGLAIGSARFPFDVFREWTLERTYGLERTPFGTWLGGYIRGAALMGALFAGATFVVRAAAWTGPAWWAVAAVGLWSASVAWSVVAPLVLRAFGGLRPLARPHVVERLRALGHRAGASLDVYEWRGGDDSRRAHAALGGVGRTRRVILSDTLLETLTVDEVEVVVAHELAHHVHGDVWTTSVWRLVVLTAGQGLAALTLAHAPRALGANSPRDLAALPVIALITYAVGTILSPVGFALSRAHERRADAFAIEMTSNTEAFLTSMRRLAASNLLEERPSRLARLLSSHPSIHERIAAAAARRTGGA